MGSRREDVGVSGAALLPLVLPFPKDDINDHDFPQL